MLFQWAKYIIIGVFLLLFLLATGFSQQVAAAGERLGGMNLYGYCASLGQGGSELNGNTWVCSTGTPITMTNACQWQYPNQNAVASQDTSGNPYTWACYNGGVSPATPTPTRIPTMTPSPTQTTAPTPTPTRVPTTTNTPTPTPTTAPTGTTRPIYTDSLQSGWVYASYNTTSSQTTTQVNTGTQAIAATLNADGGLDFQSTSGFSTTNYTAVRFALRATQSNQQYEVYADTIYGQPLRAPISLANYGGQPVSTAWKVYTIPLADLGAINVNLKDFVIHEARSVNQPILYVDQVEFISNGAQPTQTPTPTQSGPTPTNTPTPTQAATPTPTPTSSTYLALGDSFAYGYHMPQYSPASWDGYDAVFYQQVRGVMSNLTEINYACPGETTMSFINGGCDFHTSSSLHNNYPVTQSQLQAAVAYLQANAGKVSVITLDLGVNDAIALATICEQQASPVTCYAQGTPSVLSGARANYETILNALQLAAPQARIILVKAPNPVYYDGTDNLNNGLNQIIDDAAMARNLRVADAYSIFNENTVCSWTNFCLNPSDFHPNAIGYSQMAAQIWAAAGY